MHITLHAQTQWSSLLCDDHAAYLTDLSPHEISESDDWNIAVVSNVGDTDLDEI